MVTLPEFSSSRHFPGLLSGVRLWIGVALGSCVACSLQDFNYLMDAPAVGGSINTGGASASGGASSVVTGGVSASGGAPGSGGASRVPCPMYTGTGGSVVTPPSNDFDRDSSGWAMVSQAVLPISIVTGAADACAGSSYLQCKGSGRRENWDGPSLNVFRYLVANHKYVVSVAARFSPQGAPDAGSGAMILSQVITCSDTNVDPLYLHIQEQLVTTQWARFSGSLTTALTGCDSVSAIGVYVETDSASATATIDVDDFQLIDVTTAPTGTGGSSGVGGAAATGGAAAAGGADSTGGVPPTGGAVAVGGSFSSGGAGAVSSSISDAAVSAEGGAIDAG